MKTEPRDRIGAPRRLEGAAHGCEGFEGSTVGVNASAIQYHAFGNYAVEFDARVHSALALLRAGASGDVNEAGKTPHEWAAIYLSAGLKRLDMNATVPGGMDRLVLRYKLNKAAKTGDDATKALAIETLKFFKEQGSVMALRDEAGTTGELARKALGRMRVNAMPRASSASASIEFLLLAMVGQ